MRKLSNSFLLVGMILCYVSLGLLVLTGIVFIVLGTPIMEQPWREAFEAANNGAGQEEEETFVIAMLATFLAIGICLVFVAGLCLPAAILNGKARKDEQRSTYIATIVFNAICGSGFGLAGAILGIIALARKERNDRKNNVVDAQ